MVNCFNVIAFCSKKKIIRKKSSESFATHGAALDDDDDDGDENLHHREALQAGPQIPCTHCSSQPGQNLLPARYCKDRSASTSFIKNAIFSSSIWNCHCKCLTGCHGHQTDHQRHHDHHHQVQLRLHLERLAGCDHPVLRLHLPLTDQLVILILITSTFMMKLMLLKMFILSSTSTN